MKKILMVVVCMAVCVISAQAFTIKVDKIPNLEATGLIDMSNGGERIMGATSKILAISDVDVRIGYCDGNRALASLGFDLVKLEKLGGKVNYAWSGLLDIGVGTWVGYDFNNSKLSYGVLGVFLNVDFNK